MLVPLLEVEMFVEKVHAVVARSIFGSQNVQSTSTLQLGWSPWGEGFCRYKVKKWGGALQNPKQGSDPTLHSLQNGNPNGIFLVHFFLLYQVPGSTNLKPGSDLHILPMSDPSMLALTFDPESNFSIL